MISPISGSLNAYAFQSAGRIGTAGGRQTAGLPGSAEEKTRAEQALEAVKMKPGTPLEKENERREKLGLPKKYDPHDPSCECQTCKNRKYKDGSDEMVSFKAAAHIAPEAAMTRVRAHEQEHVSNAYKKAEQNNGRVIQASVSIHMAICPECGRSYVAGGTTHTQIKYYNEENPYQQDLKTTDHEKYAGANVDFAV